MMSCSSCIVSCSSSSDSPALDQSTMHIGSLDHQVISWTRSCHHTESRSCRECRILDILRMHDCRKGTKLLRLLILCTTHQGTCCSRGLRLGSELGRYGLICRMGGRVRWCPSHSSSGSLECNRRIGGSNHLSDQQSPGIDTAKRSQGRSRVLLRCICKYCFKDTKSAIDMQYMHIRCYT